MFQTRQTDSSLGAGMAVLALIYHATVRAVRNHNRNALLGLVLNIAQSVIFILTFLVLFKYFGLGRLAIRGDLILYLMSGVFLYMTHAKTVRAVSKAEGPTSAMMLHGPMSTAVAIASAALGTLYIQLLSIAVVLSVYHLAFNPISIENWPGAAAMLLVAWLFGVAVGMVFLSLRAWFPDFSSLANTLWTRANMIASGKMFAANTLSYSMLKMFDWNPLFHLIDQSRGFTFINYNPHKTSLTYPVYATLAILMLALMVEFYTRRNASLSWSAGR